MNQATIGVKEATKKRFKRIARGQYHDYFVNVLLELYEAMTPVERAEFIARHQSQQAQEG